MYDIERLQGLETACHQIMDELALAPAPADRFDFAQCHALLFELDRMRLAANGIGGPAEVLARTCAAISDCEERVRRLLFLREAA